MLERIFNLRALGSSARIEVIGGITTFVTMAYIIVLNPAILSAAGIPAGASTVATILTAAFGSIVMAFVANRPYAVAPYMGENAFIAFGLSTLAVPITWQMRLGTVFVAGVLFLVLTLFGARQWLAKSISTSLKHAFSVGIGLFLAFIGLYETGIVVSGIEGRPAALADQKAGFLSNPAVPLKIGHFEDPKVLLAIGGFLLIAILLQRRVYGAILIGMVVVSVCGGLLGLAPAPTRVAALPFTGQYSLSPIAFKLDLVNIWSLALAPVILTLLIMSLLDTTGTLVGLSVQSKSKYDLSADLQRPMLVDSISCIFAGLVGTSTSGVFIESATGIREGAKTGLAALVVGLLFLVSLFFIPLVTPLQSLGFAYGPALIIVGLLMLSSSKHIAFDDFTESVPAFATIAMMVFTYNIANGLTAGLILSPVMKLAGGKYRDVTPGSVLLGVLCLTYYLFGLRH